MTPDTPSEDDALAAAACAPATAGSDGSDLPLLATDTNTLASSVPLPTPRSGVLPAKASPDPPRIDRSVESRTHFQITLPLSGAFSSSFASTSGDAEAALDQRGWSSPHGEPYRPLGRPNLTLKFSPRLANGSSLLQNAHRMKVFEGKDGSLDRDRKAAGAEIRHAQPASRASGAPPAAPGLFDMFPLNFVNKKRPLDERQVKLAHRLHASTTHYSPDKVRGLRRMLPSPIYEPAPAGAESDSPRSHHGADAASVDLLRHAIYECSSRLRAVKNGAGFLSQVPSSEHADLLVLQEEYHRERAQFVSSHDSLSLHGGGGGARAAGTRDGLKSAHPLHLQSGSDLLGAAALSPEAPEAESSGITAHVDDSDDVYLPYTTRRAQRSPSKRHPTLTEFRSKLREEKMPRPLLSMQTASSASADNTPLPSSSPLRPSIRASRLSLRGSVAAPIGHQRPPAESAVALAPSPSSSPGRRVSVVLAAPPSGGGDGSAPPQLGAASSDLTPMTLRASRRKPKPQPQQKPHSVERLQAAVDAIEGAKAAHAKQLARVVESLTQNRRDCLATKFQHLSVRRHLDDDLREMRVVSEAQRVGIIDESVERSAWYRDLLKLLLARDAPLHPAESLLVRAIRRMTNDGHAFGKELLFRLVLLLHRDDLSVGDVQQVLAFLRRALRVSLDEWGDFFRANGLPDPAEVADQRGLQLEKLHARFAKVRAAVTLTHAARTFSMCGESEQSA